MFEERSEDLEKRINKIKENMEKCDPWHRHVDFIETLLPYFKRKGRLTHSQINYLSSIEDRYSDEKIKEETSWKESYSEEQRDIAVKVSVYYRESDVPYFSDLVQKVLQDKENHFLTKHEFTKLCMNKYSSKVLEEYSRSPRFGKGDLVELRLSLIHI